MSEDYYKLLEIDKKATDEDIKKAYKTQSLKWHPDRNPDNKDHATEMFKKINNAKNVLLDKNQRQIYDQFGEEGLKSGGNTRQNNPFNMFNSFFGGNSFFQQKTGAHYNNFNFESFNGVQEKIINVSLTLEQVYKGYKTNKKIKIENGCDICKGIGKKYITKCSICNGTGTKKIIQQLGPMQICTQVQCDGCINGNVGFGEDKCETCNGNKKIEKIISLDVNFPVGTVEDQKIIIIENNIKFIFVAKIDEHSTFKRDRNNLILNKDIPLVDALCGISFKLTLLDGSEIIIKNKENYVIKPNIIYVVNKLGIDNGDLHIKFNIIFPDKLDSENINKLSKILNKQDINQSDNNKVYYIY